MLRQKNKQRLKFRIARQLYGLFILIAAALPLSSFASDVNVAVAANFSQPMKQLAVAFEQLSGKRLSISVGSSGKLFSQINQGAPFDLIFAADQETAEKLVDNKLAIADSRFTYAQGILALVAANRKEVSEFSKSVLFGDGQRVAIANPRFAPYGRAAVESLEAIGVVTESNKQLVIGENVAQAFQFADSGNASFALVAMSQVISAAVRSESFIAVSPSFYSPIYQDAAMLIRAKDNAVAMAFLRFCQSQSGRTIIRNAGYRMPKGEG